MRIPDKHYFKIGEVAELAGVEPYVIRYWESEFRSLRPQKSRSNQRLFRRKDVERILEIRRLLYEEGYKIEGARRRLETPGAAVAADEHAAEKARCESELEISPAGGATSGDKATKKGNQPEKLPSISALRTRVAEARATMLAIEKILDDDEAL